MGSGKGKQGQANKGHRGTHTEDGWLRKPLKRAEGRKAAQTFRETKSVSVKERRKASRQRARGEGKKRVQREAAQLRGEGGTAALTVRVVDFLHQRRLRKLQAC